MKRRTRLLAAVSTLWLVYACDQLGNPPLRRGRTEPLTWRVDGVELVSSSQTFPSENAVEVFRALPPRQLQQVEPFPEVGSTVTLVAVEIKSPRRALPYNLRFASALMLHDGRVVQRNWIASGGESTFYAAFRVDHTPTSVATRLR